MFNNNFHPFLLIQGKTFQIDSIFTIEELYRSSCYL